MPTVTYSAARKNFSTLIDDAARGTPVEITRRNKEPVMIISKREFEAYRQYRLEIEFNELFAIFESTNKSLADK